MTLASRKRRPSYAEVATPRRDGRSSEADNKSNVKVVVRIRPENGIEKSGNFRIVVKAMNEHVLVFDPNEQSSPEYGYRRRHQRRDIRKRQNKDLKFAFDYVFDPDSVNHEIYQQTTKKILDSFLEGYNCSVFAYGATGAGKTHTMLGNPQKPGVVYLTMMDLYNRIGDMEGDTTCDVAVSYLEVYNEQIRDLLVGGKALPVREDSQNGVVVPGLSLHKPRDADELLHMLHYGNRNRTQHATDANAESSRSHAVFQVFVRQRDRTANVSAEVKVAKLCLVDLAGSERATVTKNRGTRFREGANINRSLLALGNVINSLADPKYKGHVPYRDSKLTRLLKDSLGGNCMTVMIAAISPSCMTYEDTYNTLKYADRAKNIQSNLKKNVLNVDFHVARYGQIVEELRKEILELKEKLRYFGEGKLVRTVCQTSSVEMCRLKEKLDGVFCMRLKYCREFLDAELKSRDLEWKIHKKEKCLARMALVCDFNGGIPEKMKKMVMSSRHRLHSFQGNRDNCVKHLLENKKTVVEMEETIQSYSNSSGDNLETENLKLILQIHQTSMALTESQYCMKYLTKVVRSQERDIQSTERMINSLLQLVKQQHFIIKGSNMMTSDLEGEYKQIQTMAEGREVSFADQTFNAGNQLFSLSGLLDFKSLPSEDMLASNNRMYGPNQQQIDNRQPTNSILHVSHTTSSHVHDNGMKSTSFAGHTPFPHKSITGVRNMEGSTRETRLVEQVNGHCLIKASENVSVVESVLNSTKFGMDKSNENIYKNLENHLKNRTLETSNSNVIVSNSVNIVPSQPLNSTFSLEESSKEEEQNSTFTLMETGDKDPDVLARTPVITDKFSESICSNLTQYESQNRTNVPNVQTNTEQVLNNIDLNEQNSQSQNYVNMWSHNANSATVSVPCLSRNSSVYTTAVSSDQSCDSVKLQQLNNVTALQSQSCDTVTLQSFNNVTVLQSQKNLTENVIALQCRNNSATETTDLQSQNCFTRNVNALQPLNNIAQDVSMMSSQNYINSPSLSNPSSQNNPLVSTVLLSRTITKPSNIVIDGSSQTLTTDKQDVIEDEIPCRGKRHAVRSITFGGAPCTPNSVLQVKSYAEIVQSPPVLRTPLREMSNNTPLSDQNQGRLSLNNKLVKRENLFGDDSGEVQETSKKLNELGLPSLMERWHTDPRKNRSQSSQQPSYMQPTKAVRYRTKSKPVNNENIDHSRVPVNQNNKNRNFKRSQSSSSLSKPGWQI